MVKITIPPKFGLIPQVVRHPLVDLRSPGAAGSRECIEFLPATPLEYLERWLAANEVFDDHVRLASVVRWADGQVSFAILQPQYHGEPASNDQIERYFGEASWTRIADPSKQHELYFNYAFGVLAIDALPRNCYLNENGLQPFDVILCRPDACMEKHLDLYPDG